MRVTPRPHVDAKVALFAGVTGSALPTITFSGAPHYHHNRYSVDKQTIRKVMKGRLGKLQHCYELAAQRDNSLAGTIGLHFRIHDDGHVTMNSVDGDLDDPDVRSCIADEVTSWRFTPGDTAIEVHYPLRFLLAGS